MKKREKEKKKKRKKEKKRKREKEKKRERKNERKMSCGHNQIWSRDRKFSIKPVSTRQASYDANDDTEWARMAILHLPRA